MLRRAFFPIHWHALLNCQFMRNLKHLKSEASYFNGYPKICDCRFFSVSLNLQISLY